MLKGKLGTFDAEAYTLSLRKLSMNENEKKSKRVESSLGHSFGKNSR